MAFNLYADQIAEIARITKALDSLEEGFPTGKDADMIPYANFVPIIIYGDLAGFITDEIGGVYSYWEANAEWREWWAKKPNH